MTAKNSGIATQHATLGDIKIAYRRLGWGSPLLLCNRFRGVMDTWDPLFLEILSESYEVIIFDYPGIGDSTGELPLSIKELAAIIMQFADALDLDKIILGGWSYGGLVAQAILLANQERVTKTILLGTNPPGNNEIPIEDSFYEVALKPVNDLEDEYILFFEPRSAESRRAARESHDRIAQQLIVEKIPSQQEVFQRYFTGSKEFREDHENYRLQLATSKSPVLIISGDHDICFAVENWFPLLQHAPNLHNYILPDSGHAPHHQHPILIANYIKTFIEYC